MIREIFVDLLYPRRCPVCDEVIAQGTGLICKKHESLPYIKSPDCYKCGKEIDDENEEFCKDCRNTRHHFERGFPVFNYVEPIKSSVLSIKYKNKREYSDYYSAEMAKKLKQYMKYMQLDAIIPVPLYKGKRRERGYNQAELIADRLSKHIGVPVKSDILVRDRETTPQKELDNLERANNIKNAIRVNSIPEGVRNVLIVDDIYTTGATIDACGEKLYLAGVQNVYFSTICIGKGHV